MPAVCIYEQNDATPEASPSSISARLCTMYDREVKCEPSLEHCTPNNSWLGAVHRHHLLPLCSRLIAYMYIYIYRVHRRRVYTIYGFVSVYTSIERDFRITFTPNKQCEMHWTFQLCSIYRIYRIQTYAWWPLFQTRTMCNTLSCRAITNGLLWSDSCEMCKLCVVLKFERRWTSNWIACIECFGWHLAKQ